MKKIQFLIQNHRAVLSLKKLSNKRFSTLKWELIEKNLDEITDEFSKGFEKTEVNKSIEKGD